MMMMRVFVLLMFFILAAGCNYPAALPAALTAPASSIPTPAPATSTITPSDVSPGDASPSDTPPVVTAVPTTEAPAHTSTGTFTPPPLTGVIVTPKAVGWTAQVVLAEGRCCVGGVVGELVEIPLAFRAQGPGGPATEMRFLTGSGCQGGDEAGISQAAWQPFATQKSISTHIPTINWIGFWVSVQYRDAQGNLSPVVCDDISMEGRPAPPTTSP